MNKIEFKNTKEYKDMVERIKTYPKNFKFTLPYYKMTQGQKNAVKIIVEDCVEQKYIESASIDLDLYGNSTEETFVRL